VNFWKKVPENETALASVVGRDHRLDVANLALRSAISSEISAPFCIPLRLGGLLASLSLIRARLTTNPRSSPEPSTIKPLHG
jgi:hypothetical protein